MPRHRGHVGVAAAQRHNVSQMSLNGSLMVMLGAVRRFSRAAGHTAAASRACCGPTGTHLACASVLLMLKHHVCAAAADATASGWYGSMIRVRRGRPQGLLARGCRTRSSSMSTRRSGAPCGGHLGVVVQALPGITPDTGHDALRVRPQSGVDPVEGSLVERVLWAADGGCLQGRGVAQAVPLGLEIISHRGDVGHHAKHEPRFRAHLIHPSPVRPAADAAVHVAAAGRSGAAEVLSVYLHTMACVLGGACMYKREAYRRDEGGKGCVGR